MRNREAKFYIPERKEERLPKLNIQFMWNFHGLKEDVTERFKETVKNEQNDAIAIEGVGFTEKNMEAWNALSYGKISIEECLTFIRQGNPDLDLEKFLNSFDGERLFVLSKLHKPIICVDLSAEQDRRIGGRHLLTFWRDHIKEASDCFLSGSSNLPKIKKGFLEILRISAEMTGEREKIITRNLESPNIIQKILKLDNSGQLKNKDTLNLLVCFGSGHSALSSKLRRDIKEDRTKKPQRHTLDHLIGVASRYSTNPQVHDFYNEAMERYVHHRELLAKMRGRGANKPEIENAEQVYSDKVEELAIQNIILCLVVNLLYEKLKKMYPSDPLDSQKPIILGRELLQKYSLSNLQKLSDEVSVSTNRIEKLIELLGINNLTKEDVEVIFERYKR